METNTPHKSQFIGLPFYLFISLLLGSLAVVGSFYVWRAVSAPAAAGYAVLFLLHIGLYWLKETWFEDMRRIVVYYLVQAFLILILISFPIENEMLNGSALGSAVICLIGQALGLWGNTRRSLVIGLAFAVFALALLYYAVQPDRYWVAVSSMAVNGGFIVLFMVVLNQQLTERQKAEELAERLESANAKLAASAAKIESLTLQNERQRMARELHDTLAQGVAGLALQLEAIKAHLAAENTKRASAIVEQSIARARSTLSESRAVIDGLRSASTNVAELAREKVERFKQATGIACVLEIEVHENQLPAETLNHAMNILSESLTNVARHAQAVQVAVEFSLQNKNLQLEVRDNGMGFNVMQETAGHYGLIGMRERARLAGGNLLIESSTNGTCVRFTVGGDV